MAVTTLESAVSEVHLRLHHDLTVTSVLRVDSIPQVWQTRAGDSLIVELNPPLALGDTTTLSIEYGGVPANIDAWGGFRFGAAAGYRPEIGFSLGDGLDLEPPPSNYNWLPSFADPTDKVSWDARFRVPTGKTVVSNGLLVDTTGDGTQTTWHYRLEEPVSTYLLFVAASDYVMMTQRETGPLIRNYVYPSRVTQAETHFANVPAVLDGFVDLFGPYPFPSFGFKMVRQGDMEHATCVAHLDQLVAANHTYDDLLFHELSHMWWGDWVTLGDWRDMWLNEGFATYCQALGAEILGGRPAYQNYVISELMPAARSATDSYSIYDPDYYWGATVYQKGACVLHMLRNVMGDSLFFHALREFGQEHAYGNAVTADYQAKCEEIYGADMAWFFEPWIYGTRFPRYLIEVHPASAYFVVIQEQTWATRFRMPLDITWTTSQGDTTITYWNDAVERQQFTLPEQYVPQGIFDPTRKVLCTSRWDTAIPVDETASPPPSVFALRESYPNPFNPATTIPFSLPRTDWASLRVYDITGRLVDETSLGELPAGLHKAVWDGSVSSSGIYFFTISTSSSAGTVKAVLLK
jgi:hypothetical protein